MADFSITISNAINAFGPAPATKWGVNTPYTMTWGTSKWGEGTEDLITVMDKVISNAPTFTDALTLAVDFYIAITNSFSGTFEAGDEGLSDGSGYSYVFTGGTTDLDTIVTTTYTEGAGNAPTYTSGTVTSTTWS